MTNQPEKIPEVLEQPLKEKPIKPAQELVLSEPLGLTTYRANADIIKFPRHILTRKSRGKKQTNIRIGDRKKGQSFWWVSSNPSYGVPGKTSFDFDYQVLHQKFYESLLKARENGEKLAPRYVVVGTLREIAKQLGLKPSHTDDVKKAIKANQAAVIETDKAIRFINERGEVEHLSGQFKAYDIFIKGDTLPDGTEAEKVILELSIPFWQALNCQAAFKPLDGQYFKELASPGAQRWYTLVSTDIFVALSKSLPYAKVRYSKYCDYHPLKRHTAFSNMKRQMEKIHQKNIDLEYIETPQYQETTDANNQKDWWLLYKPGKRAREEFKENRQHRIAKTPVQQLPKPQPEPEPEPQPEPQPEPEPQPQPQPDTPAWNLVLYFQKQKNNLDFYSPTNKELEQASRLAGEHGYERAQKIVTIAISEMTKTNFDAKNFGAVMQYVSAAVTAIEAKERQVQEAQTKAREEHQQKIQEYQDWLKQTPEERIKPRLDFQITGFQLLKHKRPPTESESEAMKQTLINSEPSPEEKQRQLFGQILFPEKP